METGGRTEQKGGRGPGRHKKRDSKVSVSTAGGEACMVPHLSEAVGWAEVEKEKLRG